MSSGMVQFVLEVNTNFVIKADSLQSNVAKTYRALKRGSGFQGETPFFFVRKLDQVYAEY